MRHRAKLKATVVAVIAVSAAVAVFIACQDTPEQPSVGERSAPVDSAARRYADEVNRRSLVAAMTMPIQPPSSPATVDVQRSYEAAVLYANCEQQAKEAAPDTSSPDEAYDIDPSGALAAHLMQEANARNAECRKVGPSEYRQVDQLLRTAASNGNLDAQGLLLRRRGEALLNGALRDRGLGEEPEFIPVDESEAKTIISELETLALQGHQESMTALDQLLSSPLPPFSDPVQAAAWRLVSYQLPSVPFPSDEHLAGSVEVLDDMDETTRQRVLAVSKSLFEHCCTR
ncbi:MULTISPECIES: hypothetical protein [unclassified Variovorax]|uniref:hypothetical protein n=1 Tax=unclassified Variovorax TaxID=663243 RepID=UPI003F46EC31